MIASAAKIAVRVNLLSSLFLNFSFILLSPFSLKKCPLQGIIKQKELIILLSSGLYRRYWSL